MRLSPAERELLEQFRAAMAARFGSRLSRLVLFGSRARGEGHEESDLDVLVLVETPTTDERRDVLDVAFDLELASGLALSPLVRDTTQWPGRSALGAEVLRDGVPL